MDLVDRASADRVVRMVLNLHAPGNLEQRSQVVGLIQTRSERGKRIGNPLKQVCVLEVTLLYPGSCRADARRDIRAGRRSQFTADARSAVPGKLGKPLRVIVERADFRIEWRASGCFLQALEYQRIGFRVIDAVH